MYVEIYIGNKCGSPSCSSRPQHCIQNSASLLVLYLDFSVHPQTGHPGKASQQDLCVEGKVQPCSDCVAWPFCAVLCGRAGRAGSGLGSLPGQGGNSRLPSDILSTIDPAINHPPHVSFIALSKLAISTHCLPVCTQGQPAHTDTLTGFLAVLPG